MRILIVSPHYFPEQFKITEIAERLSDNHEITVWTNIPNYPEGSFFKGYGFFRKRKQNINGVNVKRITTIPRKKNLLFLTLNYLSFWFLGKCKAIFNRQKFDVVLNYQLSPVTSAIPGLTVSKRQNIPCVIYVLDLWPDSLLTIDRIKTTSLLYKYMRHKAKKVYAKHNKVLVTSMQFKEYLASLGTNPKHIEYVPNHSEEIFENRVIDSTFELEVPQNKTKVLFAGNIGTAQNLDVLVEIAIQLKDNNKYDVLFMIVGDGSYKERLVEKIQEKNLEEYFRFYGRHPIERMPNFYEAADILFYSLKANPVIQKTLPGKVTSYMAYHKPIFAITGGESKDVLKRYGYAKVVEENRLAYSAFLEFVEELRDNAIKPNKKFFLDTFSREKVLSKIEEEVISLVREERSNV